MPFFCCCWLCGVVGLSLVFCTQGYGFDPGPSRWIFMMQKIDSGAMSYDDTVKSAFKGTKFKSVEAVKEKATRLRFERTQKDLQHSFKLWKIRKQCSRDRGGMHIKDDNK
ncbi:hypothetical protein TNCV_4785761 [Trichonephila clavipes]|nr:hypothetical protein TNCV_4785761 [Trichonephila clavipes]